MILPKQTKVLTGLLLTILILTGVIAGANARAPPILGSLAPILALAFMTWYLILLIVNRDEIIAALAAILLSRHRDNEPKANFLFTIIVYSIFIGIMILVLWSGLPQRFLNGLQGIIIQSTTGNQTSPPPQITPIANLFPTAPIIYYGVFVFAAIFIVSLLLILRGVHSAFQSRQAVLQEHEEEIELKQEAFEAVQETIVRLKSSKEYHETICQCYQRMCKILSDAGLTISPTETAREFAEGISAKLGVGRDAVRGLTFLFEEARYSDHRINEEKRVTALSYLESLQQVLSSSVGLGV
jgi:hypothetical protein